MLRSFSCLSWYLWVAVWLSILAVSPAVHAQEASAPRPPIPIVASEETAEADPVPAMFVHPETGRWWISGQANWISQWHPAFRSPYQGVNSPTPEAQDATSRVLTLFMGLRVTGTAEFLCDVQETAGHGIGEALGLAGATNLDVVRNPLLSKAPYVARLMWHQIISLSGEKTASTRTPFSLFSTLPARRLDTLIIPDITGTADR
jgi:high affinity Mn2+ porin